MPEIMFTGPAGRLEGRYEPGKTKDAPVALILHPHPQHGGTMNNKLTFALFQTFLRQGFATLRFNFRGVGKSQGVYDKGEGELADAASAMDFLLQWNPDARTMWVSGVSFGAWIAMQLLMRRPELDSFVNVALPANMYDFNFLAPCPSSGLFIHGERDELCPPSGMQGLLAKLNKQKGIHCDYIEIANGDHLLFNHIPEVERAAEAYIASHFQQSAGVKVA